MNAPFWLLLWWLPHLTGGGVSAVSSEDWSQYKQLCKDEVHVRCIRQGIGWLNRSDVSKTRKAVIHGLMATAYIAVDQRADARRSLKKLVEIAPCRTAPPAPLPGEVLKFFQKARQDLLKKDRTPPVITHIPLTPEQFRESGLFQARVTENLGLHRVRFHYRIKPNATYTTEVMNRQSQEQFSYQLPKKLRARLKFFQYYIEAEDCATRVSRAEASTRKPFEVFLQAKGGNARTIGGSVLTAVGASLLIGSMVSFLSANSELERWKATDSLERSEEIRTNIIILHSVGYGGIGVGLGMMAGGVYLLLSKPRRASKAPKTAPSLSSSIHTQPNSEASHGTMVRISSE